MKITFIPEDQRHVIPTQIHLDKYSFQTKPLVKIK
jgi:hypothetical protein